MIYDNFNYYFASGNSKNIDLLFMFTYPILFLIYITIKDEKIINEATFFYIAYIVYIVFLFYFLSMLYLIDLFDLNIKEYTNYTKKGNRNVIYYRTLEETYKNFMILNIITVIILTIVVSFYTYVTDWVDTNLWKKAARICISILALGGVLYGFVKLASL